MEHVLFSAAGDADWSPSFAIRHRGERHHEVKYDSHIFRFDLAIVFCEYINDIELRNHHAECKFGWEFCNLYSCIKDLTGRDRNSKRLESLQEARRALLCDFAHHIESLLQADDV